MGRHPSYALDVGQVSVLTKLRDHPEQRRWWAREVALMEQLRAAGHLERYVEATERNRTVDHLGQPILGEYDPFWARFRRAQLIATRNLVGRP